MDVLHGHLQGACKKQGNCGEATVVCTVNENPGNVPTSRRRVTRFVESLNRYIRMVNRRECSQTFVHTTTARRDLRCGCTERSWPLAHIMRNPPQGLEALEFLQMQRSIVLYAWNTIASGHWMPVIQLLMTTLSPRRCSASTRAEKMRGGQAASFIPLLRLDAILGPL